MPSVDRTNPRVIFIHIPKAAGQTLIGVLSRQYGREWIYRYEGRAGGFVPDDSEALSRAKLIIGHIDYGLHQGLPGESTYITLLRDPVQRVVSLYRYVQRTREHHLYEDAKDMDLLEFVTSGIDAYEVENGQTRQIAGWGQAEPDETALATAKENLKSAFVPGTLERFDDSLLLMAQRFNWKLPLYVQKNVGVGPGGRRPEAGAVEEIERRNRLDRALYAYANKLLDEFISAGGIAFRMRRWVFQAANHAASSLYKVRRSN